MTRVVGRLAELAITLGATSVVVFAALHAAPGDPEDLLVGDPRNATPETYARIRAEYHLDEPLAVQYWLWLKGILVGDAGRSMQYGDQVSDLVLSRLPTTLWLVAYATLLFVVGGVTLGRWAAVRRGRADSAVLVGTTLLTGIPPFVAAITLLAVFSVRLGWFPVLGDGSGGGMLGRLHHLTLPAVALALASVALIARVTRGSMIEQLGREHVEMARGRGIPGAVVVRRHVFRNALGPITTTGGLLLASMFAGSIVIEKAFALNGVGALLVDGINARDFPVVQAVLLFLVGAYVLVSTAVDLLHPLIDPRLRKGGRAGVTP